MITGLHPSATLTRVLIYGLLLSLATPVFAAPVASAQGSWLSDVLTWLAHRVESVLSLTGVTSSDEAVPLIDPNGANASPPIEPLDGAEGGRFTPPEDDGEAAPDLDPNG